MELGSLVARLRGVLGRVALVGFVLVGYWIDRRYDSAPKGVLIGAALGIIGGGYNMLRTALKVSRQVNREEKEDGDK